jgi:hypothetical protein
MIDPYATDETDDETAGDDEMEGFGEGLDDDGASGGTGKGKASADKELWLHSLRQIWEQGEDEWRAEFISQESPYLDAFRGIDEEIDRLKTEQVNRTARGLPLKTGGISEEKPSWSRGSRRRRRSTRGGSRSWPRRATGSLPTSRKCKTRSLSLKPISPAPNATSSISKAMMND